MGLDVVGEITSVGILGDKEESTSGLIVDGIFVGEDVGVGDGSEDADFVETVGDLFGVTVGNLYFFHGVDQSVLFTLYLVDGSEGALPNFGDYLEILHFVN
jgi:hypothetical protein